ncbi:MAG TPA: hypothetical protein DD670_18865 [Planctomycetaceae bacterium]|nr:hypothetical protein [Planctomycetaceae bacterium]
MFNICFGHFCAGYAFEACWGMAAFSARIAAWERDSESDRPSVWTCPVGSNRAVNAAPGRRPTKFHAGRREGVSAPFRNLPNQRCAMSINLLHCLIGLLFFGVWFLVGEVLVQARRGESRHGAASNH